MDYALFKKLLWDYTRKIEENTSIAFNPICMRYGLTTLQVRVLVEVHKQESHTIGSLAQCINMAGTNISTMCKRLEKLELLERMRDPNDERVVKVDLTEKGRNIVIEIDKELNERILMLIKDEPEEELENIIEGLQKLNKLLLKIRDIETK